MLAPALLVMATLAMVLVGCAGAPPARGPQADAPAVAVIDGEGRPLSFDRVASGMGEADVALIGEMHGHPAGLALAARLFDRVAATSPRAALSMEFLDRDQQPTIDAWLAGTIDDAELARRRGDATMPHGHRDMLEVARAHRLPVVAANAPRRFARQARRQGWQALLALPPEERSLFAIPDPPPGGAYRARFAAAMGVAAHGPPGADDEQRIDAFFRAQVLWDATMADSIARAHAAGRAPIVHVAGRFHVEHDGGLLQMVRRALPAARVFTVVMVEAPRDDDRGRADAIAYVGPSARAHR